MIQDCSLVSFRCLLEWLHTGRLDYNLRMTSTTSRVAAKLSDTEMLEVMQLADQYCLTKLVAITEVQLSERIITKVKMATTQTTAASQQSKLDPQLEQLLDELVG